MFSCSTQNINEKYASSLLTTDHIISYEIFIISSLLSILSLGLCEIGIYELFVQESCKTFSHRCDFYPLHEW